MMKVTVLVDNDTLVGVNFQGEPALSFYVEEDGKKNSLRHRIQRSVSESHLPGADPPGAGV